MVEIVEEVVEFEKVMEVERAGEGAEEEGASEEGAGECGRNGVSVCGSLDAFVKAYRFGTTMVAGERTRPTRQTGTLHDSCGVPGPCAPCSGAFDIRALRTA